ncbi:MAG: hypothetical protein ACK4JY_13190 [Brevundimonas sp.]|uniref:hypothetical protein n=1 Tax=Brevundimonas sp. TaxID=1871086 RepID=UPI00391C9458
MLQIVLSASFELVAALTRSWAERSIAPTRDMPLWLRVPASIFIIAIWLMAVFGAALILALVLTVFIGTLNELF